MLDKFGASVCKFASARPCRARPTHKKQMSLCTAFLSYLPVTKQPLRSELGVWLYSHDERRAFGC